jgi:hypothetical protein
LFVLADFMWLSAGAAVDRSEHGNESTASINHREYLNKLNYRQLHKKDHRTPGLCPLSGILNTRKTRLGEDLRFSRRRL